MLLSKSDSCKSVYRAKSFFWLLSIRTHQNIADILTKPSAGPQFRMHRNYILGISDTIDLSVSTIVANVSRALLRRRRRQHRQKSILAEQGCDNYVKF